MKPLIKYFKKFIWLFVIAILFLGIETISDLMQPLLLSKLVDEAISTMDMNLVRYYGLLMLLATAIGLIGALMRNWISTYVSYLFAKELRETLFEKLLSLSITQVEEIDRGSLVTRLTSDINFVQQFVNGTMRILMKAPLLAIGSFFMVLKLDSRFLKVYLVMVPIIFCITFIQIRLGFPLYSKIQKSVDQINQKTMEFLGGITAVRAFDRFDYEQETFIELSDDLRDVNTKTLRIMAIFSPIIMLIINMSIVYVIYLGKDWVFSGEIGAGQIIAFTNYMTQFFFAMSMISRVFNIFVRAKSSAERINEIFDMKADVQLGEILEKNIALKSSLRFEKVSFQYGNGRPTLSNLNFNITEGESIGILGATGAGKTTLIQLMNRILLPTKGEIYIGDTPIKDIQKKSLSDLMGYVPQKTVLFTGSILENLEWGKRGLSIDNYKNALNEASALDFVEAMPHKLNTKLGKNGVNVSGGQKQRLSIARALVHEPKILLLDHSTSAVDVITERYIKDQLKKRKNMTLLLIAQKASSVRDLDRIMILENGQITAFDTHQQLLSSSEIYKDLYEAEMGKEKPYASTI
ncbi:ABC transporter ATP-binding protein [Clostridium grantii]|uniref:ATP-binding cassette, subfamily B n=1 Tax=Clostridium grantii DSM 8605 TaxID=1121316 RepID=A0A1M5WN19_9CLOT|nr:ABC transporter ATP-binding protein [Clostridium grantii]SHH88514.1 ATP-binding cassette, subfamily B [Clostridium grantii DSM 8605]